MSDGGAIIAAVIFMGVVLVLATLVGAVILRAAIGLYNKLAGGSHVPEPPMVKAMGITFVTALVNSLVGFAVGLVIGGAGVAAGAGKDGVNVTAQLVSLPVSVIVMAAMLSSLLPTTFGRAFLVTLCHFVIWIMIAVVAVVAVLVVGMALR